MEKLTEHEIYTVVKSLTGEILPAGDSVIDNERIENLDVLIELTYKIVADIMEVSEYRDSNFASMKVIGTKAYHFLNDLKDELKG